MNTQTNEADNVIDNVNAPKHYTSHASGIECIQIAELLPFNLGNAIKYLWRSDLKWDKQEDTKKAIFYLRRQVSLGEYPFYTATDHSQIKHFLKLIKAVDVKLYTTCYIITFGTFTQWISLAKKLEREL